jgi:hypothetical protein
MGQQGDGATHAELLVIWVWADDEDGGHGLRISAWGARWQNEKPRARDARGLGIGRRF